MIKYERVTVKETRRWWCSEVENEVTALTVLQNFQINQEEGLGLEDHESNLAA
jgi:hypothetical protein